MAVNEDISSRVNILFHNRTNHKHASNKLTITRSAVSALLFIITLKEPNIAKRMYGNL